MRALSWGRSALLAAAFHAAGFLLVAVTFREVLLLDHPGVSFWGGILRKEELGIVRMKEYPRDEREAPVVSFGVDAWRVLWGRGMVIDKPAMRSVAAPVDLDGALKFSGPRVELNVVDDSAAGTTVTDLPSPVNVRLRYPRS